MSLWDVVGIWLAAFLTLAIFSFLWGENPLYRFAEHLFVGVSAGFGILVALDQAVWPSLRAAFQASHPLLKIISVIALLLGIMMLTKLEVVTNIWPEGRRLSHWPIAFITGIGIGIGIVSTVQGFIFPQLAASFVPLWGDSWRVLLSNWVMVLGVLFSILYFYFSFQWKGPLGGTALRLGIVFIMVAFGASFGYTVMARVSLSWKDLFSPGNMVRHRLRRLEHLPQREQDLLLPRRQCYSDV